MHYRNRLNRWQLEQTKWLKQTLQDKGLEADLLTLTNDNGRLLIVYGELSITYSWSSVKANREGVLTNLLKYLTSLS